MAGSVYDTGALRPESFDSFVGQRNLLGNLRVMVSAAKGRGELPSHILLAGPPGLGKTSLAHIVGSELGVRVVSVSGPSLQKPVDVVTLLTNLRKPAVVFIDEIHGMSQVAEETLYPAMEDGVVQIQTGEGMNTNFIELDLQPFVLLGATTKVGGLSKPLKDRFGYEGRLQPYSDDELASIVSTNAGKLGVQLGEGADMVIASRAVGTPRVANQLLSRVRDVAQVNGSEVVSSEEAGSALDSFGVDSAGLDLVAQQILRVLCTQFGGGPVGLVSLSHAVGESPSTVEALYEPMLMKGGFISRTPRGRVATEVGFAHLGLQL